MIIANCRAEHYITRTCTYLVRDLPTLECTRST